VCCRYGVFKVRVSILAHEKTRPHGRSLKTQQRWRREASVPKHACRAAIEVDVVPGEPDAPDGHETIDGLRRLPE